MVGIVISSSISRAVCSLWWDRGTVESIRKLIPRSLCLSKATRKLNDSQIGVVVIRTFLKATPAPPLLPPLKAMSLGHQVSSGSLNARPVKARTDPRSENASQGTTNFPGRVERRFFTESQLSTLNPQSHKQLQHHPLATGDST